jgi:hypothetical protein
MENLAKALEGKKLSDLVKTSKEKGSNLIEPTKEEIEQILSLLQEGKEYKEIKKTVRRVEGDSKFGFSYGQIKEVELGRLEKIKELTPVVKEIKDEKLVK